jgi:putative Holliday junction resolvase
VRQDAPILALDVGTRKIGLAQSLPMGLGARPFGVYTHTQIWEKLRVLLEAEPRPETIVVGWPIGKDGTPTPLCSIIESLEKNMRDEWPHLTIVRVDERYSSAEARERVHARAHGGGKRQDLKRIDDEAACILLEDYLRGDTGEV